MSNYLLGLLIFPFLSRVLSVDAFGLFGFSMSFVVLFQVVVEFGFMISATAQIAQHREHPSQVGAVLATTTFAKFILVGVVGAAFLAVALVVPVVRENALIVGLFLLSAIITALLPDYYFRGVEKMRSIAIRAVISKSAALALIVVIVRGDSQLWVVPVALAVGNAVSVLLGFLAIHRAGIRMPRPRFVDALKSLRSGLGFFASRMAASINQSTGALVLGLQFAPASAVMGQFSGASRIASAGDLAVIPISDSIYPHMVRTRDYKLFRRVYLVGLAFWTLGCLGVFIWADALCVLILGEPYAAAGPLLRILVCGTFMAYSSNMFGYAALSPIGLAQHANISLLVSATINVVIYVWLWLADAITAESVCIVIALTNVTVFAYRLAVFLLHRKRTWDRGDA